MANRATDSHTHKGVVSLVILIAHALTRRILAALISPGRATMAPFAEHIERKWRARVRMTHIFSARSGADAEVR